MGEGKKKKNEKAEKVPFTLELNRSSDWEKHSEESLLMELTSYSSITKGMLTIYFSVGVMEGYSRNIHQKCISPRELGTRNISSGLR